MGGIGQAQVNEIAFALFTWGASKSCADSKAMRTEQGIHRLMKPGMKQATKFTFTFEENSLLMQTRGTLSSCPLRWPPRCRRSCSASSCSL